MKKKALIGGLLVAVLFGVALYVAHWNRTMLRTEEDILAWVREEKNVGQGFGLEITGDYYDEVRGTHLLCIAAKAASPDGLYSIYFYPMEWEWREPDERWRFVHAVSVTSDMREYALPWANGYVFLSGDAECKGIKVTFGDGEEVVIPVTGWPFSYYLDVGEYGNSGFAYEFVR